MEIEEEKVTTHPHLIPDEIKWIIVYLKKVGYSNKMVARTSTEHSGRSISHQTVKRIWDAYQETGTVDNRWSKDGRPKTISEEEIRRLLESCQENRQMSVKERKEELALEAGRSTINRTLLDHGFKAYKPRKKPPLTENNIIGRLEFALEHEDWDFHDWDNVIFTDESAFRLTNSNGRIFIRRTEEEIWQEDDFQPHDTHSASVMVWGAISINGVGPLVRIEGNIDAEGYLDLFRYRLRRNYPGLYEGELVFQQDNAPVHTARIVSNWFKKKNIMVMDWPSKSPDLNIIENVWGQIKYKLRSQVFTDVEELWFEVEKFWKEEITQEFIRNLYLSLPRRIHAVLQAEGHHTKY